MDRLHSHEQIDQSEMNLQQTNKQLIMMNYRSFLEAICYELEQLISILTLSLIKIVLQNLIILIIILFSFCPQRLRKLTSSLTDLSFLGGRRRGGSGGKMEEREKENQLPGLSTMENLQMLTLKEHYDVEKELGRGTYGKVNSLHLN